MLSFKINLKLITKIYSMKKLYLLFLLAFTLSINTIGQKPSNSFTFNALNHSIMPLDSIRVKDLTRDVDTVLYFPDSVLLLNYNVGIPDNQFSYEGFIVMDNYPNPVTEKTTININIPIADKVTLTISDFLGRSLLKSSMILSKGFHSFSFSPGKERQYILTAEWKGYRKMIKILNAVSYNDQPCRLTYSGHIEKNMNLKSQNIVPSFLTSYHLSDTLLFIGYITDITVFGSTILDVPQSNKRYTFNFMKYDGKMYTTAQIGSFCWFKENLNVGIQINGSQNQTNNGVKEKYCFDDLESNCEIYGGLYQWDEMMQYDSLPYDSLPGAKGICPEGWRLPTNTEWMATSQFLGDSAFAGGRMKESEFIHWNSPNSGGANSSGFTALPAGLRGLDNNYYDLMYYGLFFSSSAFDSSKTKAMVYYLSSTSNNLFHYYDSKQLGLSARCLKDINSGIANITTDPLTTNITQKSATSGGEVKNQGNSPVTARGVCWSDNRLPTLNDNFTNDGSGPGTFISNLDSLVPNTRYYIRAYATNGAGTAYGKELSFTTLPPQPCPGLPTLFYDGQTYHTVQIGEKCWFKENLNVGSRISGSVNQLNNGIKEKYCSYDLESNCAIYGGLYQWNELMQYDTIPGIPGLCPTDWHLPTDEEWSELTTYLGGVAVAGGKMKESGTAHWQLPNTEANNSSGFTALPGGYRNDDGYFFNLTTNAYYWTSSKNPASSNIWSRYLYYGRSDVKTNENGSTGGFSARCVKNN